MAKGLYKRIGKYVGQILITLLGISFISFALIYLAPGDTAKLMIAGNEDIIVSQAEIEAVRHEFGLDQPFLVQYWNWLCKALHGDLGMSYMSKIPVTEKILAHLPATIYLALSSIVLTLAVSLPIGLYAAAKNNRISDYIIRLSSFFCLSLPNFWIGLILLWIFGLKLRLLPIIGGHVSLANIILPTVTLTLAMSSKFIRQVRAIVLEELHKDYVIGARSRGMGEWYILFKEVLPNALLPLITLLGMSLGSLLGGTAVVEIVFSWPGLGRLAVEAITYRDFFTVQGIILWIAVMYMIINIMVDISYYLLDPRLRRRDR